MKITLSSDAAVALKQLQTQVKAISQTADVRPGRLLSELILEVVANEDRKLAVRLAGRAVSARAHRQILLDQLLKLSREAKGNDFLIIEKGLKKLQSKVLKPEIKQGEISPNLEANETTNLSKNLSKTQQKS